MNRILLTLAACLMTAGCGSGAVTAGDPPSGEVATDARLELECEGEVVDHGAGYYDDGLARVQDSAAAALEDWLDESSPSWVLPRDGYSAAVDDGSRVLLVHGQRKVAVVVSEDVTDWDDDTGWGVTSWAACDPSELAPAVSDALGVQVWEDASGDRVPTGTIQAYTGAEHCDWQDLTFLEAEGVTYVDGDGHGFGRMLRATYDADAELPDDATDTGYRRDGRELWVTREAAYLVSSGGTERWPAFRDGIGCA